MTCFLVFHTIKIHPWKLENMQKKEIINAIKILIVLLPGILICIFNLDQYPAYFWDESYYFHQAGLILSGNASDAFYSLAYPNLDVYLFALFRILAPTIYTSFYFMRYGSGLFAILTGLLIYKVVILFQQPDPDFQQDGNARPKFKLFFHFNLILNSNLSKII